MYVTKLADIAKQRAAAFDQFDALANKDKLTPEETKSFGDLQKQISDFDEQAIRVKAAQAVQAKGALPVAGQAGGAIPAQAKSFDAYIQNDGLALGGVVRMLAASKGNVKDAGAFSSSVYGEQHPVTKAFAEGTGPGGGFLIAPDFYNQIIELLRAQAVVRKAGPLMIPMPRGNMTVPGQASAASASYTGEGVPIATSAPTVDQITATAKKLTALVPISNDLLRDSQYSTAADALVRDDLVQVIALREDLAFLTGDGTLGSPRGFSSFANAYGSNLISSTYAYSLATVNNELTGAINKLDTANVVEKKRVWFMHPRTKNYLNGVQNSLGLYVYREELSKGMLYGYPFFLTTQIPVNVTFNANPNCSQIMLVEMTEAMIFDTMQLELMVSMEGTYLNSAGTTVSAVASDQTLVRAIARHDFQMRHDASVAMIQGVAWSPAIS